MIRFGVSVSAALVAATVLGGVAVAGSNTLPAQPYQPSTMEQGQGFAAAWNYDTNARDQAFRVQRATKAAALINAGKCDKALKVALKAGDHDMAARINTVCAAPASQARS